MPLSEIERVYETIIEKNGDADHDRAFETFSFEEKCLEAHFWCNNEMVKEQRHMMLPYGTVITQAKEQPPGDDFQISVEFPWGYSIRTNADLKDAFSAGPGSGSKCKMTA